MNFRKTILLLASALALTASVRADDLAMNNAPATMDNSKQDYYAPIITRNVFGLNPPIMDTNPAVDPSLPKITPNGIVAVFGKNQVLFKVAPTGKASQGAKEQYYTLSEGERQDDIEVMHIDSENGIITFKNHGTVQELPLAAAPSSGGGSPSPLPGNPSRFNPLGGNNGENPSPGNRFTRFGNRGGGPNRRGNQGNGAGGNGDDSLNLRSIPTRTYQPPASNLTPEQSAILIEAQRAKMLDEGNKEASLLPPTPLTGKY